MRTLLNFIWILNFIICFILMILSYKSGEFEETLAWSTALIYSFVIFLYDIRNIIDNKKKEYPDDIIDNED
jgi:hypothetical protein